MSPRGREPLIEHVADTACWVATYRAVESTRPDALFRDPFAHRFAGERGQRIVAGLPRAMRRHSWPMVMRTKAFDDLIMEAVSEGTDCVVNLAAGFDARPYRLALPNSLKWVEADLPAVLEEKQRMLRRERPRCRVVRAAVDLSDPAARSAFLDEALAGADRALVFSEGLVLYLDDATVGRLASDLASRTPVRSWVLDLISPGFLRIMQRQLDGKLSEGVEMRFAPRDGVAFFSPMGWKATVVRSVFRDAARLGRLPWTLRPWALFPEPDPTRPGMRPWSAVVRLDRDATPKT